MPNDSMIIMDPIYGFISFSAIEKQLVNTRAFQRLRRVRQLALADLVYPGALHTRFDHSLGTMHLAGKVTEGLARRGESGALDSVVVRIAALLHDIGHGPYSHVSEQVLDRTVGGLKSKYKAANAHELLGILILEMDPEIGAILPNPQRDEVVALLQEANTRALAKDIVSGPLDVDKIDYLFRDSYFTGVRYGLFDRDMLMESFVSIDASGQGSLLGVTEQAIPVVEQLALGRYHMTATVYRHRIRRITDAMLVRALELAIEDGLPSVLNVFTVRDCPDFISTYLDCDDHSIPTMMKQDGANSVSTEMMRRLNQRRLLKEVFSLEMDTNSVADSVVLLNLQNLTTRQHGAIATEVAHLLSAEDHEVSPKMVIVDKHTLSNPTFKPPEASRPIEQDTIMVRMRDGSRRMLSEASPIIREMRQAPHQQRLLIYAPMDWIDDRDARQRFLDDRQTSIRQLVMEVANGN
jgi:hypothetical protein